MPNNRDRDYAEAEGRRVESEVSVAWRRVVFRGVGRYEVWEDLIISILSKRQEGCVVIGLVHVEECQAPLSVSGSSLADISP